MEVNVEDALAPKELIFTVKMACPRLFNITANDVKRLLDSEGEQIVTKVELIENDLRWLAATVKNKPDMGIFYICPRCKADYNFKIFNYCPSCGAKLLPPEECDNEKIPAV